MMREQMEGRGTGTGFSPSRFPAVTYKYRCKLQIQIQIHIQIHIQIQMVGEQMEGDWLLTDVRHDHHVDKVAKAGEEFFF